MQMVALKVVRGLGNTNNRAPDKCQSDKATPNPHRSGSLRDLSARYRTAKLEEVMD